MSYGFRPRRNNFPRNFRNNNTNNADVTRAIMAAKLAGPQTATIDTYVALHSFADFIIHDQIKNNIRSKNYQTPTPIQDQAIPAILEGRDVIGIANTGTGKTAAFLIPLIDKVSKNHAQKVLIVTPTRELALQIYQEFREFSKNLNLWAVLCIGGESLRKQVSELRRGGNFVIGTPGRIKDLVQTNNLHLNEFNNVVLDEADRMVDIGFIADIKFFISLLPIARQSLFFSATISRKVEEILKPFVHNPITVSVKKQEIINSIEQDIIKVTDQSKKVEILHDLLNSKGFEKVLIFGRTKWGVQRLADELCVRGFKAGAIHGNKKQSQRRKVLEMFKSDQINILLATDVASRGLDINGVSHVINYDIPSTYDDYIHRIGRTGRANKTGIALTFVS